MISYPLTIVPAFNTLEYFLGKKETKTDEERMRPDTNELPTDVIPMNVS